MPSITARLTRKKKVTFDKEVLPRVLSLVDLTLLGIGSTVGVGFYILAGQVARNIAGPAVTISFLIAGIASVFAGLCYAEFGSRVPKAGSAYIYSYVCVGEFTAFVVGWNLVLEYVIGTASVARGFSGYIDVLANNSISNAFDNAMHMGSSSAPNYPDFLSFTIVVVIAVVLCIGVKESSAANNVFTAINLFVIAFSIIACSLQADPINWELTADQVNMYSNDTVCFEPKYQKLDDLEENPWGDGGFSPYGIGGIMQGAATCFFGFVGFDVIATAGEEAMNPGRNIPLAIVLSLTFVFASYFGLSVVLTMALPYCMQDPQAPLIQLFDYYEMIPSKWIVSIGALFGFSASLFGVMFPMPRILYSMADDGLIFRFMSRINKKFKTPVVATCVSSSLAAIMALMFSLDSLVNMMSIGTLMAYTTVAISIMVLRYSPDDITEKQSEGNSLYKSYEKDDLTKKLNLNDYFRQLFNLQNGNGKNIYLGGHLTLSFSLLSLSLAILVNVTGKSLIEGNPLALSAVSILAILSILNLYLLDRQPQSNNNLHFKVPFVPWLPGLSAFINMYLMCNLPVETWIRFAVWMTIGLALYFLYGMKHSIQEIICEKITDNVNGYATEASLHVPHIYVHPPTPASSLRVSKLTQKRVSISDNAIIINDLPYLFQNMKQNRENNTEIVEQSTQNSSASEKLSDINSVDSSINKSQPSNGTNTTNEELFLAKTVTEIPPASISIIDQVTFKLQANLNNFSQRKSVTHSETSSSSEPSTPKRPRRKVLKRGRSFDVLTSNHSTGSPQRYIITPIFYDDKSSTDVSRRPSDISI